MALTPYRRSDPASLPGNDRVYLDGELRRIEDTLKGLTTAVGSGAGTGGRYEAMLSDYGTLVPNTNTAPAQAANDAAIAAAVAQTTYQRIWVPEGDYYTATSTQANIASKVWTGPGRLLLTGGSFTWQRYKAGDFTYLDQNPSSAFGSSFANMQKGDLSKSKFELYRSAAGIQNSVTQDLYFEPTRTPHYRVFMNDAGHSGCDVRPTVTTAATVTAGTPIAVTNPSSLSVGMPVGFLKSGSTVFNETSTIASINVGGSTITLTTTLTGGPYDTFTQISRSYRHQNNIDFQFLQNQGGGDSYAQCWRISSNYIRGAGQDHFFFTNTCGMWNGDVTATQSGIQLQISETQIIDSGHDIAVFGDLRHFERTNATGALGCIWIGHNCDSVGSEYCDAAYVVSGKWNVGLDFAQTDFGTTKSAIRLKDTDRLYWGCSATADFLGIKTWGNTLGNVYVEGSGGGTPYWKVNLNSVDHFKITPTTLEWDGDDMVGAWASYSPSVTAQTGTLTSASGSGYYKTIGKTCFFRVDATITTNGTGTTGILIGLPFTARGSVGRMAIAGRRSSDSAALTGNISNSGATSVNVRLYNGTYPVAVDGEILSINGVLERA